MYRYELIRSRKKYELKHTREKEVLEKQHMITLEKRRVELVSMVQRQNASHREEYDLIAPWSLSKGDIKLMGRNKTNDVPTISLYDGEVVINGSIYECLIKVYKSEDTSKEFGEIDSSLSTPTKAENKDIFDIKILDKLKMLNQNKHFELFIGVGMLDFSRYFCVYVV